MNWLKSAWAPFAAAGLVFLAILAAMAAAREKAKAEEWAQKALDIEEGNVVKGVETAAAANTQAALHDNLAKVRNDTAAARITQIGEKNAPIADVLDNWRKS